MVLRCGRRRGVNGIESQHGAVFISGRGISRGFVELPLHVPQLECLTLRLNFVELSLFISFGLDLGRFQTLNFCCWNLLEFEALFPESLDFFLEQHSFCTQRLVLLPIGERDLL